MSEIIDTLYVNQSEVSMLMKTYPNCRLEMTKPYKGFQRYKVTIPGEGEEDYLTFLVNSRLAMSSMNFLTKLRSDDEFAREYMPRIGGDRTAHG